VKPIFWITYKKRCQSVAGLSVSSLAAGPMGRQLKYRLIDISLFFVCLPVSCAYSKRRALTINNKKLIRL
jgi:hypothetical protein